MVATAATLRPSQAEPASVSRRTLVLIGLVGLALAALNLAMVQRNFFDIPDPDHGSHYLGIPINLLWIGVGLYAWARRPANPTGKWMIAVGFAGFTYLGGLYPATITWLSAVALTQAQSLLIAFVFLSFPTGHLRARTDRIVMAGAIAWTALAQIALLVTDGHFLNPFFLVTDPASQQPIWNVLDVGRTVLLVVIWSRVIVHWKRAPAAGRRTLTPVLIGTLPYILVLLANRLDLLLGPNGLTEMSFGYPAVILPGYALPIAFLVGLLRTQLARSAIGDVVRELDAGIEPGRLVEVLRRALGDPSLQIAYRLADGSYADADGHELAVPDASSTSRVVTPLGRHGEDTELLIGDRGLEVDPELVAGVAAAARLALENERLQAEIRAQLEEVRASRARIVEAGLEARRKVERDLHDGAQQQLLALSVRLQMARGAAAGDPRLEGMLTSAGTDLDGAIAELRGLARGIHPTVLTELGLAAAVEGLADRAAIPIAVDVTEERFPELCEATAYFVVSEALANVAKHARASRASISIRHEGAILRVEVGDDGEGGAALEDGGGLHGLVDRVAALGGTLTVDSPPAGGTRIVTEIPCG